MATHPPSALSAFHNLHDFLQPSPAFHSSFLDLAKSYFDPLAINVTTAQEARQRADRASRKRKRKATDDTPGEMLKMRKIHIEGFDVGQVWQQTRRILESTVDEVERELLYEEGDDDDDMGGVSLEQGHQPVKAVRFDEDGFEAGSSENDDDDGDDDDDSLGEEGVDWEYEGKDDVNGINGEAGLSDEGSIDLGAETPPSDVSDDDQARSRPREKLVKDKFGLNDGFFSIDDFNKQSQFMEQADAKGEDDGAASDEEDVDWEMDPLMGGVIAQKRQPKEGNKDLQMQEGDSDEDKQDGDEDGPTFGDMDINAPEGDSDMEDEDGDIDEDIDMNGMSNTNDITYADFFAPPAEASGKKRKPRRSKQSLAFDKQSDGLAREEDEAPQDADLQRAMSSVHRDLFDDELSEGDDPEAERDPQDAPSNKNLSTHERRQLALRAEIRRLEAQNVGPKDWSLGGETLAPARPVNSLLEEDLDFERAGKPVPIVTDAVNEDIEALIKRRILARDFDEVIRRRPTDLVTGQQKRRGLAELSDQKPTKGLAEEYEDEHLRKTDPNYVDQRSEALKAKHADIEKHYAAICRDLDVLSNLHYKPKPAASSMDVRVDVPKIAMEEARPSVAGAGVEESVLAPQEIYQAGADGKQQGEIMTRGGTAVSREEQTREQKKRHRQREKERTKKSNGNAGLVVKTVNGKAGPKTNKKEKKEDVVRQLGKGGVKVIDKKGDVRDVDGKTVKEMTARAGGGNYKL